MGRDELRDVLCWAIRELESFGRERIAATLRKALEEVREPAFEHQVLTGMERFVLTVRAYEDERMPLDPEAVWVERPHVSDQELDKLLLHALRAGGIGEVGPVIRLEEGSRVPMGGGEFVTVGRDFPNDAGEDGDDLEIRYEKIAGKGAGTTGRDLLRKEKERIKQRLRTGMLGFPFGESVSARESAVELARELSEYVGSSPGKRPVAPDLDHVPQVSRMERGELERRCVYFSRQLGEERTENRRLRRVISESAEPRAKEA